MKNIFDFGHNLSIQKTFFWAIISITIYICVVYSNISLPSSISFHFVNIQIQSFDFFKQSLSSSSPNIDFLSSTLNFKPKSDRGYLIDTESCHLEEWPLFDKETLPLFVNYSQEDFHCFDNVTLLEISRVNATWIRIEFPQNANWECFASEIQRSKSRDGLQYGSRIGPIGKLTNFANNLTFDSFNDKDSRWDAVKISCTGPEEYSLVVPLIQHYKPKFTKTHKPTNPQMNVILIGIDSISRLNFYRHMKLTERFLETHNFTSLEGYHKVGENTFPNLLQMLTGNLPEAYYKQSMGSSFKFDDIPFIWKNFHKMGYVTTFVEDMPEWGIFVERGGFAQQPTDYYLRPVTLAIDKDLYFRENGSHPWCYRRWLEHEIYWNYMLDQFEAFKSRNQSHFTFAHLSTFTHDLLNQPGRLDRFYHKFLDKIFARGYHTNSVIILFSDHGIRYGGILNTTAGIQEQRLPFVQIYVPETLVLNRKSSNQIREILKLNQNRLTSHFDLHATMMHVLYGNVPEVEPYGISLFTEIPTNRTCAQAGIKQDYCLCNSYNPIPVTSHVRNASSIILKHMNQLMFSHGNHCVPLTHGPIYRAFNSYDTQKMIKHRLIHFQTEPNTALMEGMVQIDPKTENLIKIVGVTRISQYWEQSRCVQQTFHDIETFCYCWDAYKKDLSKTTEKV